jgi:phosphate transport system ATP-binding protein
VNEEDDMQRDEATSAPFDRDVDAEPGQRPAQSRRPPSTASSIQRGTRPGGVFEAVSQGRPYATAVHDVMIEQRSILDIEQFNLWYGPNQALYANSMRVTRGAVTALIGPSGCGKSTLLRSVNRMNDLVSSVRIQGDMRLSGDSIYGAGVDVIQLRKRIGMVFQKPNPFPMSIY